MKFTAAAVAAFAAIVSASPVAQLAPGTPEPIKNCTPVSLVAQFLDYRVTLDVLGKIIAKEASYVSLNYVSDDFKQLVPWTGTHHADGPVGVWNSFLGAASLWVEPEFAAWTIFGDDEKAAAFGNLTYVSKYSGKTVKSLFSLFANVSNCQIQYLTFQTDNYLLSTAWRVNGTTTYHPHPIQNGTYITLPPPEEREVCVVNADYDIAEDGTVLGM